MRKPYLIITWAYRLFNYYQYSSRTSARINLKKYRSQKLRMSCFFVLSPQQHATVHVVLFFFGLIFLEAVSCLIRRKASSHAGETDNSHRAKCAPGQWLLWSHYKLVKKDCNDWDLYRSLQTHMHTQSLSSPLIPPFSSPSSHFMFSLSFFPYTRPHFCLSHSQLHKMDKLFCLGNIKLLQSPRFTCWDLQLLMLLFGELGNKRRSVQDRLRLCSSASI